MRKLLPWVKAFSILLVLCVLTLYVTPAQHPEYSDRSVSQLIDDLAQIDSRAPGIDGAAIYEGFIAYDPPGSFQVGVLGVDPPKVPPQMRELVRRGPLALAELVKHVDDPRPTKLLVGNDESLNSSHQVGVSAFMFSYFSDEYDPRSRESQRHLSRSMERGFHGRYSVKVGDVCYVIIGQIVNRRLLAVRYQPSAGLVINSPVEVPSLADRVRKDWGNADAEALKASLLADLHAASDPKRDPALGNPSDEIDATLERLGLYFPDAYNSLQGRDLKLRRKFEEAHRTF